jgi:hypothetical protein
VQGTEVVLKDGTVLWMQVPNPFERDEATHDGQVARSRLVMAVREHGSDELAKVKGCCCIDGPARAVDRLVDAAASDIYVKAVQSIQNDPDWKERLEIREPADELLARPAEDSERRLLVQLNNDYLKASSTQDYCPCRPGRAFD